MINQNSKIIANYPSEEAIFALLSENAKTEKTLAKIKNKMAEKYKIPCPKNTLLLQSYHNLVKNKKIEQNKILEELLKTSKIRSLSGIVVVSILTSPRPKWGAGQALSCPGKCLYCPSQKGIPKSYLNNEPAVMRAIQNDFDPYRQVQFRLRGLKDAGHPIDKINIRVIGGTWSYYPKQYQIWFITKCFEACNEFNSNLPLLSSPSMRGRNKVGVYPTTKYQTLENVQKINEKAKCRIVEISIETRPDYIDAKEIKRLRQLGVTKVELGIQSLYDDVLKLNKRGHGINATIRATKLLKDAGFKVSYQMMLNLPGSDFKRDLQMFKELFRNPAFCPDHLKIYPLAIVKEAPVYKLFRQGKIKPYSKKTLIKLLKAIKEKIPYYCRIERVIRDIPSQSVIAGGVKISSLRQNVLKEMEKDGLKCKCIRCREIKERYNPKEKIYLFREDYDASGGREIFLSFESIEADKRRLSTPKNAERKLYAILRLRIPSSSYPPPLRGGVIRWGWNYPTPPLFDVLKNAAVIRELHTYGQMVPISQTKAAPQHKGLGKKLVKEA